MNTAQSKNIFDRLVAAHRAFRAGKTERAVRAARKAGIEVWGRPDANTWEQVVSRMTGSIYGYTDADLLAGLPNQVPKAKSMPGNILPRY